MARNRSRWPAAAGSVKQIGRDDGVGHSGFIFQTEKNKSFCGSGTLADDDASSDAKALAVGNIAQFAGAADAHGIEPVTAIGHGMRPDGESGAVEVGDQAFFVVHGLERRRRIGFGQFFEQRSGRANGAFDLPEGIAAMKLKLRVPSPECQF